MSISDFSFETRVAALFAWLVVSSLWARFASRNYPPGIGCFICVVPVLIVNLIAPYIFVYRVEVLCRYFVSSQIAWLANFKLLAMCFGRGPLFKGKNSSMVAFGVYFTQPFLPIFDKDKKTDDATIPLRPKFSPAKALLEFLAKLCLLGACAATISSGLTPIYVNDVLYGLAIYGLLGVLMDAPANLATVAFGIRFENHFNSPWLSTSLGELWAYRWNLVAGSSLKDLVFDPIMEGGLMKGGKLDTQGAIAPKRNYDMRKVVATSATFFVSGLMHMMVFSQAWGHIAWKWMLFFVIQAPLIVLEQTMLKGIRKKLPRVVKIAITLLIFDILGHFLFVAEAEETGFAANIVQTISSGAKSILTLF